VAENYEKGIKRVSEHKRRTNLKTELQGYRTPGKTTLQDGLFTLGCLRNFQKRVRPAVSCKIRSFPPSLSIVLCSQNR